MIDRPTRQLLHLDPGHVEASFLHLASHTEAWRVGLGGQAAKGHPDHGIVKADVRMCGHHMPPRSCRNVDWRLAARRHTTRNGWRYLVQDLQVEGTDHGR